MQAHSESRADALRAIANYGAVRARLRGAAPSMRAIAPLVAELPPAAPVWRWLGPLEEVDPEKEREGHARIIYESPIGPPATPYARAQLIVSQIMAETGLTIDQLKSARRDSAIVRPRQRGMWMLDRYTTWSLGQIGRFFGKGDHSTVIHAIRQHQRRIDAGLDESMRDAPPVAPSCALERGCEA